MTRDECYTFIAHVEGAALRLAEATAHELDLEDQRPLLKAEAIKRLMEVAPNPLTGKAHSVSSAEAIVEQDPAYWLHRRDQRGAVVDKIAAQGKYEAAKLRARLAVELVAIDEPARDPDYEIVGEHCPDCDGTGDGEHVAGEGTLPCKRCSGRGVLADKNIADKNPADWFEGVVEYGHVDVPMEFDDGAKVRVERIG